MRNGIWTKKQKRTVRMGKQRFSIRAFPTRVDYDEIKFVNKLRVFRKEYKNMYYLILIVPSQVINRVERDYPDIYDDLCEGRDIPKMLYSIKNP